MRRNYLLWPCLSLLTFILYDVVWMLVDFQNTGYSFDSKWLDLVHNLTFSLFFSGISLWIGDLFVRHFYHGKTYKFVFVVGFVLVFLNIFFALVVEQLTTLIFDKRQTFERVWESAYSFGLISSLSTLIYITYAYHKRIIKDNEEKISLKLRNLKMQLDPHFLFNSLSVLSGLISLDPVLAERFTIRLARIYRSFTKSIDCEYLHLEESLALATDYMELMKVRFPFVSLKIKPFQFGYNEHLVSLSLQIILENAVKHNMSSAEHPIVVEIDRCKDMLVISNNRTRTERRESENIPSLGLGLSNLKDRTRLLCGKDLMVINDDIHFEVKIPIIVREAYEKNIDH
jgi:LytS/YehU family sensor histidine kinase